MSSAVSSRNSPATAPRRPPTRERHERPADVVTTSTPDPTATARAARTGQLDSVHPAAPGPAGAAAWRAVSTSLGLSGVRIQCWRRRHRPHPFPKPVPLVHQVADVELGVLELRGPVQRVERAHLDADAAVHAQREVDREPVEHVALRSRPPSSPAAPSPCASRCRCTSPGTRGRRACRPCSSPRAAR